MADLLVANMLRQVNNEIKKKFTEQEQNFQEQNELIDNSSYKFDRPTHLENSKQVTGGNACCVCIPDTATSMVIEMWGQGGGGSGANCCQWGCYGGQGGDYASKTIDLSDDNQSHILCLCACHITTKCCCTGTHGQFSRVCDCTSNESYIVKGGCCGISACMWCTMSGCSAKLDHADAIKGGRSINSLRLQNTTSPTTSFDLVHDNNLSIMDFIFDPVDCEQFDMYRRGSCGFSGACVAPCNEDAGIGGAAYAGGDIQTKTCNSGSNAYCGACGNFPGGGGHGSGACGGSNCQGSVGGNGLIIISWE